MEKSTQKIKFPDTELFKFGQMVLNLLVDNFPSSFFVGGTVRDLLLKKEVGDIDIATSGKPEQVAEILKNHFINFNMGYKNLGVVIASQNGFSVAITTFRQDFYKDSRYPKTIFIKDAAKDSLRRDFTINSLYLSPKDNKVLSFQTGLKDLKNKKIKFIGEPEKRIQEDPLRILRAIRFALELNFKLEKNTKNAIKKHFDQLKKIGSGRVATELEKIKNPRNKKLANQLLNQPKYLDKIF